jgi:hypothetical protein
LSLSIGGNSIESGLADTILENIAGLESLRSLELIESGTTNEGIRHLNELGQLTRLRIYQEGLLTDAALLSIVRHKHLKSLDLTSYVGTQSLGQMHFTSAGTLRLSRLKELENLNLSGHELSPELFQFAHLKSLIISGHEFDPELAEAIANCRELTSLDLFFDLIWDGSFARLASLSNLSSISLRCRVITDDAVALFQQLPKLTSVRLWTRGLSDQALVHLSKVDTLNSLCLTWAKNNYTLDGLKELNQLPHLKHLDLQIIPMSGGIDGIEFPKPDDKPPTRIVLGSPLQRPSIPESQRKRIRLDLDALFEALPRTRIDVTYDHSGFDPRDK